MLVAVNVIQQLYNVCETQPFGLLTTFRPLLYISSHQWIRGLGNSLADTLRGFSPPPLLGTGPGTI